MDRAFSPRFLSLTPWGVAPGWYGCGPLALRTNGTQSAVKAPGRSALIRAVPASGFHASFPTRPPRQSPLRRAKPTGRFSAQDFRRRLRARAGDRVHGRARAFPFPAIPSPLRCFRRRCSWTETLARACRERQGDEKARHRRLPAAGGQEIHIRQCTHGKSASAAFTTSGVIGGTPGGATRTGCPLSSTSRAAAAALADYLSLVLALFLRLLGFFVRILVDTRGGGAASPSQTNCSAGQA